MKKLLLILALLTLTFTTNAQWTQTNGPEGGSISALVSNGINLFAASHGGGVFLSINNGNSWVAVNNGLTNTDVQSLIGNGIILFAGTNSNCKNKKCSNYNRNF